jgi:rhomboid protease GluP
MSAYPPPPPVSTNPESYREAQPIQVQIKSPQVKPIATYVLVGITVFFYLFQALSKLLFGGADFPAALGAKVNQYIELGQVWRFITPIFLHGSILHIALNMYALFVLGPSLERFYGHFRFLMLYCIGGFCGNVASYIMSTNNSLGASTAIFALILAQAVFVYQNRKYFGSRAKSMLFNMGFIVILNLVLGLSPGIDNWGHLGGLIGGAIFSWFAGPIMELEGFPPILSMKDKRDNKRAFLIFLVILVIAGGIAIAKIMS